MGRGGGKGKVTLTQSQLFLTLWQSQFILTLGGGGGKISDLKTRSDIFDLGQSQFLVTLL